MFTHTPASLCALCLILLSPLLITQTSTAQQATTRTDEAVARRVLSTLLIKWQGKPGVERYRLQVATDAAFNDIIFDQAVVGREHLVRDVSAGRYFWRIAPAVGETGQYTLPTLVVINPTSEMHVSEFIMPADLTGWRTATGEVLRPVSAQLRAGTVVDVVGVNRDGLVYAIDGTNGTALWTARYRPDTRAQNSAEGVSPFDPIALQQQQGATDSIVVAFDGGVRALRGETGREVWRATLEGRPASGVAGDLNGDGKTEVAVVTRDPHRLYVLEGSTGHLLAEKKLGSEVVGNPILLTAGEPRGVALALKEGAVEILGLNGNAIRRTNVTSEIMTAPLVVRNSGNALMVVGTREGLLTLTLDELKTTGRIVTEGDGVQGTLTAADLDGDGTVEIIMLTRSGRAALVSTVAGKVKWYSAGATDGESAVFADVNSDGVLDVIVPGGDAFAVGYSGSDGSLVWKVEETGGRRQSSGKARRREFMIAPAQGGSGLVVGSDPSRVGLRAVELPKGALRAAAK